MTIVEVMAAMLILVVGVLGTLVLIEGGIASTSRTTAREQGTNLARDLVERTRQAAYADVTTDAAPATLRAMLPASDAVGPLSGPESRTFTLTRRNVQYTVTVFACSIDDPTDGAGVGDATFCEMPTGPVAPGDPAPGSAAAVNVLGIAVTAGANPLATVCGSLGITSIADRLAAVVDAVAPLSVCPGGDTAMYDRRPDDLRRVRVDVAWNRGAAGSVSQTTLLTNPLQS